ncbi:uncharacterized protein BP5553_04508 [Venustampulla echinocandica]|uniref:Uncharacterized protein n=1 Tax=Venustampulla echinocandica TaxID=2656787 RepID=A0A370TNH1_9HELO|nr:uncharacterized protein BP5553_04508 [Venustampulla echinocandica]RDL37075.1 hypothetical protein BP5553_04508 [Venustampulla echinocandica]
MRDWFSAVDESVIALLDVEVPVDLSNRSGCIQAYYWAHGQNTSRPKMFETQHKVKAAAKGIRALPVRDCKSDCSPVLLAAIGQRNTGQHWAALVVSGYDVANSISVAAGPMVAARQ